MSDGFTVRAGELAAGGKSITGLFEASEKIGIGVATAIGGMCEAASGHAGLAAALLAAAEQGAKTFLDIGAAYDYTSTSLSTTASTYKRAEDKNTSNSREIGSGTR